MNGSLRWVIGAVVLFGALASACEQDPTYARIEVDDDVMEREDAPADTGADADVAEDSTPDEGTTEDTAGDVALDPDTPDIVPCAQKDELACLREGGCVLEQSSETGAYLCRAPQNPCEAMDFDACSDDHDLCEWFSGACYCPPDVVCGCGGGPPPMCRQSGQLVRCSDLARNCGAGDVCCTASGATTGVCLPAERCNPEVPGACQHDLRVSLRLDGGLCESGPCFTQIRFESGGYIFFDDERPSTPVDGQLDPTRWLRARQLLAELATLPLQEGYGECCNAFSDGSDAYITFYERGDVSRIVRISDASQAPDALAELQRLMIESGYALANANAPAIAACPGLPGVPRLDGPASTCDNAEQLVEGWFNFALEGPDAQGIAFERYAIAGHDTLPAVEVFDGVVTASEPGTFTLETADRGAWTFLVRGQGVALPCLVTGQAVTATVRVEQAFEGFDLELVLRDRRGVLFAMGHPGGLADGQLLPFVAEIADVGCPPGEETGCGARQASGMVFYDSAQRMTLRTAEWGRFEVEGGYDLAILDLASLYYGFCDANASFTFLAWAIAGSDLTLCEPSAPSVCDLAADRIQTCIEHPLPPASRGLAWPSCEGTDRCAAECAIGLPCSELRCSWDGDIDCDGIDAYERCVSTCQERTCQSDDECVTAVDCCANQFVCFDVDDPVVTCDRDCDPFVEPPPCTCIDGQCATAPDTRTICERGAATFNACNHQPGDLAPVSPAELDLIARLMAGECSDQVACYAGCIEHNLDGPCAPCHFGPALCEWDPMGECVAVCLQ